MPESVLLLLLLMNEMLLFLLQTAAALRWPLFASRHSAGSRTFRLLKGDVAEAVADALVTSANPMLEGTRKETHWRFAGRANADSAVRAAGGRALTEATSKYAEAAGPLKTSSAHPTRAGGSLSARWIIHCVAPNAQDHAEPLARELLEATYTSAIRCASSIGARSVALPTIGTGVAGFTPEMAADCAFAAARAWLAGGGEQTTGRLRRVDVVIFADNVMRCWSTSAIAELGDPDRIEMLADPTDRFGVRSWTRGLACEERDRRAEAEQAIFGGGQFVPGFGTFSALDD